MQCSSCAFDNPPGMRFCGACGARLPTAASESPPVLAPSAGERRHLTVLFCDLVGSTALAERLELEDLREVVAAYQDACASAVRRFDGYVAQYLGDGLLVYFGYPAAHEDDAQRAVAAGLDILAAMAAVNARLESASGPRLSVRIGIHTGMVVVGEVGQGVSRERLALGQTPNLAARLEALARPDTILISETTHGLVAGFFECEAAGSFRVKGITQPVEAFEVRRRGRAAGRFEAAVGAGLLPLVGRRKELAQLLEAWARARNGDGRLVQVSGEAGIGKSRLLRELKEHIRGEPHRTVQLSGSSFYSASPLYPVVDLLRRGLRLEEQPSAEARLDRLEAATARSGLPRETSLPLLASLLAVPLAGRYPSLELSPQRRREETADLLLRWLEAAASRRPVLLAIEDAHWIDPSTLDLLGQLVARLPGLPLLAVLTHRSGFAVPWPEGGSVVHLPLQRLEAAEVHEMLDRLACGEGLADELANAVVVKADGVPLFVEELGRMLLEGAPVARSGGAPSATGAAVIPGRLQDLLAARLDRLGPRRELAQLASVLGREVSVDLLASVAGRSPQDLAGELAGLVEAGLLVPRGRLYAFRHALLQETAYQSLLKPERRRRHRQIAAALEQQGAESVEGSLELLAHHSTEAGLFPQAVGYWLRAGRRALERWANVEASRHLAKGLELVECLPVGAERDRYELGLLTALAPALMATRGFAAAEVEQVCARALALCQEGGDTPLQMSALWGLIRFYSARSRWQTARELGERLAALSREAEVPEILPEVHRLKGASLFHLGEFAAARDELERGLELYRTALLGEAGPMVRQNKVPCLFWSAYTLWFLGRPEGARRRVEAAMAEAERLGQPFALAGSLVAAAMVHHFRREPGPARRYAEAAVALAREHRFPHWAEIGGVLRGAARVRSGEAEEGLAEARQGLEAVLASGVTQGTVLLLATLAELYLTVGRPEEAAAALERASGLIRETGECYWEAEVRRLEGELAQAGGTADRGAAEASLREALAVAARQGAHSLELRASLGLARFLVEEGRREEGRRRVAEVYGVFEERPDVPDLREARAFLAGSG